MSKPFWVGGEVTKNRYRDSHADCSLALLLIPYSSFGEASHIKTLIKGNFLIYHNYHNIFQETQLVTVEPYFSVAKALIWKRIRLIYMQVSDMGSHCNVNE